MGLNQWSLLLSIIGLALGVVSAYPQLRRATQLTLKLGVDGVNRLMQSLCAQADFFIAYPSALVAYIGKSTFYLAIILLPAVQFLRPNSPTYLPLPSWLQFVLVLSLAFVAGKIGGDMLNILRLVVRRARDLHNEQPRDG